MGFSLAGQIVIPLYEMWGSPAAGDQSGEAL